MEFNKTKQLLNSIGNQIKEKYKFELKNNSKKYGNGRNSYASGKLYNSIDYDLTIDENNNFSIYFVADDYWIDVEQGRKPNQKLPKISIAAIKKWMINRSIKGDNKVAFLILRSIEKKGILPKPYLKDIKKEIKNVDITKQIEQAVYDDYKLYLKNKVKEINNQNKNK